MIGAILNIISCTTTAPLTYGPSNKSQPGYFEQQRGVYKWMVGSYYNLESHTPQQAANIVMRRAAEIASQNGFKWVRILNYKAEARHGLIGSLPATVSLNKNGNGTIYGGMDFYGNQDEVDRIGANHAVVEYIEFSRKVDCQNEKCGVMDFFLEKCNEGWDGGIGELSSKCHKMALTQNEDFLEKCIDRARFVTKDFCSTMEYAAYKNRGLIEERNLTNTGDWYKTADILEKYTTRTEKWALIQKKR